jgi:hypothetical protein
MCFYVAAMTLVPVAVHVLARIAFRLGPLQNDTLRTMAILLLAVPLFIHFCSSISPGRMDASFVLTRPATVGQMTMARLKAAAISTAISWAMVFAALAALPLLGDFHFVEKSVSASPECRAVIVIGLIFLTWRIIAVNVWSARLAGVPFLALLVLWLGIVLFVLDERGVFPHLFRRLVPFIPTLLACLVAVKLLLAFLAFRVSLKRGLLGLPAVIAYLAIWALLVAAFLALVFIVPPPPREWTLPLSLGIVLVVPLARIGFGPIALARARHT